jgi:hypothetical protein
MTPTRTEQWNQVMVHLREAERILREMARESRSQGDSVAMYHVSQSIRTAKSNVPASIPNQ